MKHNSVPLAIASLASVTLLLAGCGGTSPSSTGGDGGKATAGKAVVKLDSATVSGHSETVLANNKGFTLYYFTPDTMDTSACTGSCASTWPALLLSTGTPGGPAALNAKLSTMSDANGRQVTFNGHPLYTYSGDSNPGQANGEGIEGKWFVATPSLSAMAAPKASPSASQSPYGY